MNANEIVLDFNAMRASASQASNFLKVLANPDRLLLLCQLSQGEQCVGDLEKLVGIRQPTLSQQLTILRTEGLVDTRREGKLIYYSITSQQALAVMNLLYEQYCQPKVGGEND